MNELAEVIAQLPIIVDYVVPGFVFVNIYFFFTSRFISNEKYRLVMYVISSSIIQALDKTVLNVLNCRFILENLSVIGLSKTLVVSLSAVGWGIIAIEITESSWFNTLCRLINHKSIHENIFRDVIDYEGSTLELETQDGTVMVGKLHCHEEKGEGSWFVLSDYVIDKISPEDKQTIRIQSTDYANESMVMVRLSDVKQIRIFYGAYKRDWLKRVIDWFCAEKKMKRFFFRH